MKTETNFDASKITFFFYGRRPGDFRKLVKMLVKEFRSKIEMRQVGIRNQPKCAAGWAGAAGNSFRVYDQI
ncbi:MAG: PSP1 C-terminal domain-containing protein [Desulfobacterales bacterium]